MCAATATPPEASSPAKQAAPAQHKPKLLDRFLTHLAVQEKVSASTQNQALSALLSYPSPLLREAPVGDGYDIRTIPELLGHKDVKTTMIYTHALNKRGRGVRSPADAL